MSAHRRLLLLIFLLPLMASRCEYASQPYFTDLAERISGGNPPDIGYVETMHARELIAQDALQPVSKLIASDEFFPQSLEVFTSNGEVYAIPRDMQTVALIYNGPMFDELGLSPPTTWEELVSTSKAIVESGKAKAGIVLTAEPWNWLPFLYQAGGALLTDGRPALDSDAAKASLDFYVSMVVDGLAVIPDVGKTPSDATFPYDSHKAALEMLQNGDAAMALGPNDVMEEALKLAPNIVRAAPLPAGPNGQATIGYVTGLGAYAPLTEQSTKFLTDATSPDAQTLWNNSQQFMPTRPANIDGYLKAHPESSAFVDGIAHMANWQPPNATFEAIKQFDRAARQPLADAVAQRISVEAALKALQELAGGLTG